jgi:hypothetical protein
MALAVGLTAVAAALITANFRREINCWPGGDGIYDYTAPLAAVLIGVGSLLLLWSRRWRFWYAAFVAVTTLVLVALPDVYRHIGLCTS